jgi:hypothetical protein
MLDNKVQVPYAILKPSPNVKLRTAQYKKYKTLPLHMVATVLRSATANSKTPVVIDLETTSALAHDKTAQVAAVSLASSHSVVSINVKDNFPLWKAILTYLYVNKTPLLAHNATFDMAWMLRDFNPDASYYNDFKQFNFVGCTYAIYRHLASEGFRGQKWSLGYAQETLLNCESNKAQRDRKLIEQGLLKKHISEDLLLKLCGSAERLVEYRAMCGVGIVDSEEDKGDEE